mgnify:CR=1 FL=1
MKRILVFIFALLFVFQIDVFASEEKNELIDSNVKYEYFEDGSYLVIEFEYDKNSFQLQSGAKANENYTVTGHRTVTYYDGDDNLDWKVTITGVFLIVPTNSLDSGFCQSADLTYKIYDSSWHIYNIVEQEITNNACGSCTMKRKFLGITTKTVDVDIYVSCDYAGNLS